MIGQVKLKEQLHKFNINDFPKSIILIGKEGSGKHLFTEEISTYLNINRLDLDEGIDLDIINNIYISTIPTLYILDMDKIANSKRNDIQQNRILKLLEEPPKAAFIVLLVESTSSLLNTIINRCQLWYIDKYTEEELLQICPFYFDSINEPGQLLNLNSLDYSYLISLCDNVITNLNRANASNILSIADKLDYRTSYKYTQNISSLIEGDKNTVYIDTGNLKRYCYENNKYQLLDKLDYQLFLKILLNKLYTKMIDSYNNYYKKMFDLTQQLIIDSKVLNVDKKLLIENYLIQVKLLSYEY